MFCQQLGIKTEMWQSTLLDTKCHSTLTEVSKETKAISFTAILAKLHGNIDGLQYESYTLQSVKLHKANSTNDMSSDPTLFPRKQNIQTSHMHKVFVFPFSTKQ